MLLLNLDRQALKKNPLLGNYRQARVWAVFYFGKTTDLEQYLVPEIHGKVHSAGFLRSRSYKNVFKMKEDMRNYTGLQTCIEFIHSFFRTCFISPCSPIFHSHILLVILWALYLKAVVTKF